MTTRKRETDVQHTPSRVPTPGRGRSARGYALLVAAMFVTATLVIAASVTLGNVPLLSSGLRGTTLSAMSAWGLAFAVLTSVAGTLLIRRGSRTELVVLAALVASELVAFGTLTRAGVSDWLQASALVVALPLAMRWVERLLGRHMPHATERLIVIGSGDVAERTLAALNSAAGTRTEIVGYVDEPDCLEVPGLRRLGSVSDLAMIVRAHAVNRIVVAFSQRPDAEILASIRDCDGLDVEVSVVPRLFDVLPIGGRVEMLGQLPILTVGHQSRSRLDALLKRVSDIVGSLLLLVVFSPIFALAALAVLATSGRPIIFRQNRVGRGGAIFKVLKFRTMKQVADRSEQRITDLATGAIDIATAVDKIKRDGEQRITRVGNLLRKSSIDELPQLINVLKGEMSLVGPRPLRDFEVAELQGWQRSRIEARPGMTGLWQVSGRSDVSWDERVQLDYRYVRHWSVGEDVKILAKTLPAVLAKRGAV